MQSAGEIVSRLSQFSVAANINWHVELCKCATNISHICVDISMWNRCADSLDLLQYFAKSIKWQRKTSWVDWKWLSSHENSDDQTTSFSFFFLLSKTIIKSLTIFWSLNVCLVFKILSLNSTLKYLLHTKNVYNNDERNVSHLHLSNLVIHSSFSFNYFFHFHFNFRLEYWIRSLYFVVTSSISRVRGRREIVRL